MAQNLNTAYAMWRQSTGGTQAPGAPQLAAPGVQAVRVAPARSNDVEALRNFASNALQMFQGVTQQKQAEVTPKVQAWMAKHTMAEYQQLMREGNVPFQNDAVAMDILHNQSAYNTALQVEEGIQKNIQSGMYKSNEEAEKSRINALNAARSEYALSMGISPDSKAFNTGFDRDYERRRTAMMNLQADVTDKYLRTQAKTQVQADLLAPLTPDFVKAAPAAVTAQYITNTIQRAETLGQIRSDADKTEVLTKAMQAIQGSPGGASAIQALGETEVSLYGVKAPLRDHLGGGTFDQAVLKARQTEQTQDATRQGNLQGTLLGLQNAGDVNGLMGLRKQLQAESGDKMTPDIQAVDQTIAYVNRKQQADNAVLATKLLKEREKDARLFTGINGLMQLVSGQGLVSPDGKDLGFKDEAEAREGEERLLSNIPDEGQRLQTAMKLASLRKDGYAANALKTWGDQAVASWGQYTQKLARGEQGVQVPEQVTRMANLYEANPEGFSMQFKDAPYISALEASKVIGASMEDVARAQVEWGKLPKDSKKAGEDALTRQLARITARDSAYVSESLKVMAAPYLTMGVPPEQAVGMARESFDRQHTQYNGFPIHKGFFQVSGDRESYTAGTAAFDAMLPKLKESIGNPSDKSLAYWYDQTNQSVVMYNLQTGEQSSPVTRGDLHSAAAETARKEATRVQSEVDKAVQQENYKRAVSNARADQGIFPGNRLEGDSGFSGAPIRR